MFLFFKKCPMKTSQDQYPFFSKFYLHKNSTFSTVVEIKYADDAGLILAKFFLPSYIYIHLVLRFHTNTQAPTHLMSTLNTKKWILGVVLKIMFTVTFRELSIPSRFFCTCTHFLLSESSLFIQEQIVPNHDFVVCLLSFIYAHTLFLYILTLLHDPPLAIYYCNSLYQKNSVCSSRTYKTLENDNTHKPRKIFTNYCRVF